MITDPNKACRCNTVVTSKTGCESSINKSNCISLCNLVVPQDSNIFPCGTTGTIDLTGKVTLPSDSTGSPIYSIAYHSDNLKNVSVVNKIISFTSDYSDGKDFKSAKIVYKVKDGIYEENGTIIIVFKQVGNPYSCNDNEKYNPCTGACDSLGSDLEITSDGTSSYLDSGLTFE